MKATLQVVGGNGLGRRIDLRDGQVAQFGRTEWADYSFRDDAAMGDVHFAVECRRDGCFLKPLVSDRDTLVNNEKAGECRLRTGDRITAGLTTLAVAVEGDEGPSGSGLLGGALAGAAVAAASAAPPATDFVNTCTYLDLKDAIPTAKANPALSRDAFLDALIAEKKYVCAARLRAHWLPKRAAVWWGCLCIGESCESQLAAEQQAAVAAARDWVAQQDEPSRRRAEAAFAQAGHSGPGGMLAAAAFGAGDSLAPENSTTAVPPDPRMTGSAVKTALLFAAYHGDPRAAEERWRWFLVLAQDIAGGKISLPGDRA